MPSLLAMPRFLVILFAQRHKCRNLALRNAGISQIQPTFWAAGSSGFPFMAAMSAHYFKRTQIVLRAENEVNKHQLNLFDLE